MRAAELPPAPRVAAATVLLERGWGKAPQAHTGEDGEGAIAIVIRHLVEGMPDRRELITAPLTLEAQATEAE